MNRKEVVWLSSLLVITLCLFGLFVANRPAEATLTVATETANYPDVPLATVAQGKWLRPRAKVTGTVDYVAIEKDGDLHVRLIDGPNFIVCEFVPEHPAKSRPKLGDKITVFGIVRHDGYHKQHGNDGWNELHPAWGWEIAK